MEKRPLLVIAGLGELAGKIRAHDIFPKVVDVETVRGLLNAFTGPDLAQRRPDDVVLVFADTLTEDHDLPLPEVIRRLTGAGYHVVIVSVTARGAELSRQFPKAGLLPTPVRVNDLLYAINTFGYAIDPVEERAAAPEPAPRQSGGWGTTSETPQPATPNQGGWGAAAPPTEPARPAAGWGPAGGSTPPRESQPVQTPQPARVQEPVRAPEPVVWQEQPQGTPDRYPQDAYPPQDRYPTQPVQPPYPAQPTTPTQRAFPPLPTPTAPGSGSQRPALFPAQPAQPGAGAWSAGPAQRDGHYPSAPAPASRRGHVITVAAAKGGVGKSSLTLNLGAFLGMRLRGMGKTVCVIDANFQQADAGKYLDQYTPNINTIAQNTALLTRERILEGLLHKQEYNLSVLLGPATPDEGNPLNIDPELYVEILDLLRHHFDYIVIDTPVAEKYNALFIKFALPKADFVVIPVSPNLQTLHNVDNWIRSAVVLPKHAGGAGIDPRNIGIVLNRREEGVGCDEADVRAIMANWPFLGSIPETKEWKLANNNNELVAPKAYAELNQAFAAVLYAATGEAILVSNIEVPEERRGLRALVERLGRKK